MVIIIDITGIIHVGMIHTVVDMVPDMTTIVGVVDIIHIGIKENVCL